MDAASRRKLREENRASASIKNKPPRTLGLSLAILASVMLFTVFPMIQVAMILLIRYRFQNAEVNIPGENSTVAPVAVGSAFAGLDDTTLWVQLVFGVIFLVIAVCAWRGRPRWIRFVMLAAVVLLTLVTIALSLAPLVTNPDFAQGIDSGAAIRSVLLSGRMLLSILVALYVVWYINRGPARAYYRGYYLPVPESTDNR